MQLLHIIIDSVTAPLNEDEGENLFVITYSLSLTHTHKYL